MAQGNRALWVKIHLNLVLKNEYKYSCQSREGTQEKDWLQKNGVDGGAIIIRGSKTGKRTYVLGTTTGVCGAGAGVIWVRK